MIQETRNITGRGVAVFVGAFMLLFLGLLIHDGAAMTLGICGLLLTGTCYAFAPRNLRGLRLKLRLPHRFRACRSVTLEVELRNERRLLGAYNVDILMRFPQKIERSGHADWTSARSVSLLRDRLSIPSRSCSSEVGCEFRSRFPLGLFQVRLTSSVDCPVLVYPRLITPTELLVGGSQPDLLPTTGATAGEAFGEPRGIRVYQPGDAANWIHLAATTRSLARGHGLRVRAYDPPGFHPNSCRIIFHSYSNAGEMIRLDRYERSLSLVAGTLAHFQSIYTNVIIQAEFTNWLYRPCENRSQYFECLAQLAKSNRPARTPAHKLIDVLQGVPTDEQLILISDSPPYNWIHLVPTSHKQVIIVDIRQIRFKQRRIQLAELLT
ncbi:MAG: hypothetical protein ACI8UO_002235 [Verrucomicrobiales bacterium]